MVVGLNGDNWHGSATLPPGHLAPPGGELSAQVPGTPGAHNFLQVMARLLKILGSVRRGPRPACHRSRVCRVSVSSMTSACDRGRRLPPIPMRRPGTGAHSSHDGRGGELNSVECLGTPAWQALHQDPEPASMGGVLPTRFTQGGVDQFLPSPEGATDSPEP